MFKVDDVKENARGYEYVLNEVSGFDDFKERLIID
jgi:hypothetical protein